MKMKYIFWLAASFVGYSYLGYPVWLWLRSRWSPRPVRRSSATPSVSAVMVVRNEEAIIARKLDNLLTLDYPHDKLDVVVVSDGSSDGTAAILAGYAGNSRVRIVLKPASQGKAAGLNDAIRVASGDVLLFTDARQQIEPEALRLLIENFADTEVGAASGELMLGDPTNGETGKGMGFASWSLPRVPSWAPPERFIVLAAPWSPLRLCRKAPFLMTYFCPCRWCARVRA